jgi:hypothetical protein
MANAYTIVPTASLSVGLLYFYPQLISKELWPPSSPDLSPADLFLFLFFRVLSIK